jgi:four helix bundle protein
MFTHEKFRAYQKAIDFYRLELTLISDLPAGHATLADQFRRASLSIVLNIAEETGKSGHSDRRRFYLIAGGSAMECAALCDVAKAIDCGLEGRCEEGKEGLREVVGILTIVCGRR